MNKSPTVSSSELSLGLPPSLLGGAFPSTLPQSGEQSVSHRKSFSVSELTSHIRGLIEPSLTQVWVQGEITNYRPASSGHAYFSLKDANSTISAAIFGWGARKKAFELKEGLLILCRGKVSVYPPRGTYQLVIDYLQPLGAGALQLLFEQLKAKLSAEGLFDPQYKKPLPQYPKKIVVITSPTGAVIQDMLNMLKRRARNIEIIISPALVQGEDAARQIVAGIEYADRNNLADLIVLARGGGSAEDLACFNDEKLARAIFACKAPIISAVGHEVDFTIADFVADLRAPTPSAAAEMISGGWVSCIQQVQESSGRMRNSILRSLAMRKTLLSHVAARVISPSDRLREQAQRIDDLSLRLGYLFKSRLEQKASALNRLSGKLDVLSPLRVLERGYTLVKDPFAENSIVKSMKQIHAGQELEVKFHDGETRVRVL